MDDIKQTHPAPGVVKLDGDVVFGLSEIRTAFQSTITQMGLILTHVMEVNPDRRVPCVDDKPHIVHEWMKKDHLDALQVAMRRPDETEVFKIVHDNTLVCTGRALQDQPHRVWQSTNVLMDGSLLGAALANAYDKAGTTGMVIRLRPLTMSGRAHVPSGMQEEHVDYSSPLGILKGNSVTDSIVMSRLYRSLLISPDGVHMGGHAVYWAVQIDALSWKDLTGKEHPTTSDMEWRSELTKA